MSAPRLTKPHSFARDHQHCMDRTGVNYVQCLSLTHCPSVCDCPVSACTASALTPGTVFATPHESGCVVISAPDAMGLFDAYDSEMVVCRYQTTMPLIVQVGEFVTDLEAYAAHRSAS